ncbi:MAG: hypothetical protein AAGG08_09675 [Actinomycetota bacterium]
MAVRRSGRLRPGDVARRAGRTTRPLSAVIERRRRGAPERRRGVDQVDRRLRLADTDLGRLVERFGSPLHVLDLDELHRRLASATSGVRPMASVEAFRPSAVLSAAHARGWGVIARSTAEVDAAAVAGVEASAIVFAPAVADRASLEDAAARGVGRVQLGSPRDADRWSAVSVQQAVPPIESSIGVRWEVGHVAAAPSALDAVTERASATVRRCRALGLSPAAIAIVCDGPPIATSDVAELCHAITAIVARIGPQLDERPTTITVHVDLLPARSRRLGAIESRLNRVLGAPLRAPDGAALPTGAAVEQLRDAVRGAGPGSIIPDAAIELSTGSSVPASSQLMLTSVVDRGRNGPVDYVMLDAGINLVEDALVVHREIVPVDRRRGAASGPVRLVGPICTPADVLAANSWLPDPDVGDVLAMFDTGGASLGRETMFSFPRPAVVGVSRSADPVVLRRAETFEDLVSLDALGDLIRG